VVSSTGTNPHVHHKSNNSYVPAKKEYTYTAAASKDDEKTYPTDEIAAILELTKETQEKLKNKPVNENERAEKTDEEGDPERPSDETRSLTRRLVSAKSPDDVQHVLVDVYDHLREWQALAAAGDKEAIKVVRKLQKLISRGNRKIKDLHKEMVMHQRQQKAENEEKKQEAKRLEIELKEALRERKARERRYLQERDNDNEEEESQFGPSIAETEAKIRQLAAAKAALSIKSPDAGNVGSIDGVAVSTGEGGSLEGSDVSEQETSEE